MLEIFPVWAKFKSQVIDEVMAKKTVATLQTGKTDGRSYTKVIKMVKNPSGSYSFDEQMVPNEAVKDFFKN